MIPERIANIKNIREETYNTIKQLQKYYSLKEIACKVGVAYNTLWRWSAGLDMPRKGDLLVMKEELKVVTERERFDVVQKVVESEPGA
jgi:transcriptional regulator with XRE-family HTH domain